MAICAYVSKCLLLINGLIALSSCSSSDEPLSDIADPETTNSQSTPSTINTEEMTTVTTPGSSSLPAPISETFFDTNTIFLDISVYSKQSVGPNMLEDQLQSDLNNISELARLTLLDISDNATFYAGEASADGRELLNRIPDCPLEIGENPFVYLMQTTSSDGSEVTLINSDACGQIPGITFDDITGQGNFEFMRSAFERLSDTSTF